MRIYLIYGPQGSGKTTQAKLLADKFGLTMISAGEISRQIALQDTPQGKEVRDLIGKGEPTPKEIIVPAVNKILNTTTNTNGFVFDGYPRYAQQIESLAISLEKLGWDISKVIIINLTEKVGVERVMGRAAKDGRADDNPESIARRLELYRQQTKPIIDYFRRLGKVIEVDGSATIEEVNKNILTKLESPV